MKTKTKMTLARKRAIVGLLFISPWLIGFCLFFVRSLFMAVQFSLSDVKINVETGGYTLTFVGLQNYITEFTAHGSFKQVFTESVINMLVDVPLIIFFSLFMAMMLNRKFKGRTIVRAIFFLPVIMNSTAITGAIDTIQAMMQGGVSAVSSVVENTAVSANMDYYMAVFKDLAMPDVLLDYVVGAADRINAVISASGVQIVIFIAALQSIPASLYEVARIEGATTYETFWKVTLPMVTPHIITNIVYTIVDSFIESEIVTLAYDTAFTSQMWGLSSAMSLTTTVTVCFLMLFVCGFIQKRAFYYN